MKKIGMMTLFSLSALAFGGLAQADYYYHEEYHYGGGYYGGYHGGYHHGGGGYGDGFVGGLLASTMSLFALTLTEDTAHHKELVYIGAADEAAAYIQNGGEPSALLREAMDTERSFLVQAKVENAQNLDDQTLAELIVGRAASLNQ